MIQDSGPYSNMAGVDLAGSGEDKGSAATTLPCSPLPAIMNRDPLPVRTLLYDSLQTLLTVSCCMYFTTVKKVQ
jgi:hypothetical protein